MKTQTTLMTRYYDAHSGMLGILALFTEISEINPTKIIFCRKPIFVNILKIHKYCRYSRTFTYQKNFFYLL